MGALVKIDFMTPTAINLDDTVSLRDVYDKLIERGAITGRDPFANWVKVKTVYYAENTDYSIVLEKTKTIDKNGKAKVSNREEYYTSVQIAMEILANGHGQVGHDMRRFMSGCVRKVIENNTALPPNQKVVGLLRMAAEELEAKERALATEQSAHTETKLMLVKATESVANAADIVLDLRDKVQIYETRPIQALLSRTMTAYEIIKNAVRYPNIIKAAKEAARGKAVLRGYTISGIITIYLRQQDCVAVKVQPSKGYERCQYSRADIDELEQRLAGFSNKGG